MSSSTGSKSVALCRSVISRGSADGAILVFRSVLGLKGEELGEAESWIRYGESQDSLERISRGFQQEDGCRLCDASGWRRGGLLHRTPY